MNSKPMGPDPAVKGWAGSDRRRFPRHPHPMRIVARAFGLLGIATLFYAGAVVALAVNAAIIEF